MKNSNVIKLIFLNLIILIALSNYNLCSANKLQLSDTLGADRIMNNYNLCVDPDFKISCFEQSDEFSDDTTTVYLGDTPMGGHTAFDCNKSGYVMRIDISRFELSYEAYRKIARGLLYAIQDGYVSKETENEFNAAMERSEHENTVYFWSHETHRYYKIFEYRIKNYNDNKYFNVVISAEE